MGAPGSTRDRGQRAEDAVAAHLAAQGFTIIERNVAFRGGEIDLVAREGRVLCFVEVRSRRSAAHGHPLETVNRRKRQRLVAAARAYLARRRIADDVEIRFDVAAVVYEPALEITLVRGAFDASG